MKKNIVLTGMTGCGKSTIGKALSFKMKKPFIDIDNEIERRAEMTIPEIFDSKGEAYFRQLESNVIKAASQEQNTIISTGGGAVKSDENMRLLKQMGIVVYINRPVELIEKSIRIENRPLLKNGTDILYEMFRQRHPLYVKYADVFVVNSLSFAEGIENVYDAIKNIDLEY